MFTAKLDLFTVAPDPDPSIAVLVLPIMGLTTATAETILITVVSAQSVMHVMVTTMNPVIVG